MSSRQPPPCRKGWSSQQLHWPRALNLRTISTQSAVTKKGKGSPYSTAEPSVQETIPVLGSRHAGDVSHKPGSRLPLLSARSAVTFPTRRPVPILLVGEQRHDGCEQFA